MLIASSLALASALAASAALTARPLVTAPPLVVGVTVVSDISPALVRHVLQEAGDIWLTAGVAIVWQQHTATAVKPSVRVTIGNWKGAGVADDNSMPLGWIVFTDGAPEHEIYVSSANAIALIEVARGYTVSLDRMPRAERDALLGRAMGRALAHELGHFLLESSAHSARGLMQARRTATEFFSNDRSRFAVEPGQRAAIAARRTPPITIASRSILAAPDEAFGPIR